MRATNKAICWLLALLAVVMTVVQSANRVVAQSPTAQQYDARPPQIPLWEIRQTTFGIPFTIDPAVQPPREVRLYVSSNLGKSWHVYAREKPDALRFRFRATADGEYWFAVRAISGQATGREAMPTQPEMRVIVDTRPPRIEFSAQSGPDGEVIASWNVEDDHLRPRSFKVEYQAAVGQSWRPVATPSINPTDKKATGKIRWWPETTSRLVHVRAAVQDAAGNVSTINRRVALPARPLQTQNPGNQVNPIQAFQRPSAPGDARTGGANVPWPADHLSDRLPGQQGELADLGTPIADDQVQRPPTQGRLIGLHSNSDHVKRNVLPPGIKPRVSRGRRFHLSYRVEESDRVQLTRVELWITRDGGRTWQRHADDNDLQSPCPVEVRQDGAYGFRIVLAGRSGLLAAAPAPGDDADIWVVVDSTPPAAQLLSARYGRGPQTGTLDIRWRANDPNLIARPVSLMYSAAPDGPWTTIAADLPNTGAFLWQVENNVPRQVYLRLSVLDSAGNEGGDRLTDPIRLEGLAPKGRIVDILPAGDAP